MARSYEEIKKDLEESLAYTYGKKIEASNKDYDRAISQQDRTMLGRGMQRSSYGAQVLANMEDQKIKAANDIRDAMIADYKERMYQAEKDLKEDERYEEQMEFQRERAARQDYEFDTNLETSLAEAEKGREHDVNMQTLKNAFEGQQNDLNRALTQQQINETVRSNQAQESLTREGWDWQSNENALQRNWQSSENAADRAHQSAENAANRSWQSSENAANREWQSSENAANRSWQTSEREATQAYNTSEREATQAYNTSEREATQKYNTSEREATQAYNTNERKATQNWQSAENALNRAFQTSERIASQAYNTSERKATQNYNTSERMATQNWQSAENATNRAFQTSEREASQKYNTSERKATQKYNTGEREATQAWQSGENTKNRDFESIENALNRALTVSENKKNRNMQQEQFDYQKTQDAFNNALATRSMDNSETNTERNYYSSLAVAMLELGNMPSADILEKAGLTEDDAKKLMKQTASSGTGGNGIKSGNTNTGNTAANLTATLEALLGTNTNLTGVYMQPGETVEQAQERAKKNKK